MRVGELLEMRNAVVSDGEQVGKTRLKRASVGCPAIMAKRQHAVVGADDVWSLLPRLKAAGASGILVLPIEKIVP